MTLSHLRVECAITTHRRNHNLLKALIKQHMFNVDVYLLEVWKFPEDAKIVVKRPSAMPGLPIADGRPAWSSFFHPAAARAAGDLSLNPVPVPE
jgi:hypothetical protein